MNQEQVSAQLDNMVSFILQEAKEKAEEIEHKTKSDSESEKSKIVEQQMQKINDDFEKKQKQILIAKKIAESNEINNSRIEILREREQGLLSIYEETKNKLHELTNNTEKYRNLLEQLILQGLVMMTEEIVSIQCRKEDLKFVNEVMGKAKSKYETRMGKKVDLSISDKNLPSYPNCNGGIILSALHGRIICNNTLDARLKYAYDTVIPKIRYILFERGVVKRPKEAPKPKEIIETKVEETKEKSEEKKEEKEHKKKRKKRKLKMMEALK